jgi:hypothetical protein
MQNDIQQDADTVVCHFSLLYPSFKEDHQVIQNYIRDVINYFKKGFSSTVVRQIPRYTEYQMTNTTAMGEKRGKKQRIGKECPFYQPIGRQD